LVILACIFLPQVGTAQTSRLVQAGTRRLELVEAGEGSPTIVVEAGLGADWHQWSFMMDTLATMTHVVGYARAGYSRSDPAEGPQTAEQVVDDLFAALQHAGIKGPYLMLGHSYGGILVRIFAARHSEDISGLLLVDPSHPAQVREFAERWPESTRRLEGQLAQLRKNGPSPVLQDAETLWRILSADTLPEAAAVPDVPTIVITSTKVGPMATGPNSPEGRLVWRQLHDRYLDDVTLGAHILTAKSGHNVQADQPLLIVDAVRQLLEWIR
jgi:pimeloyl-ACP methyl ester carboxylesterase